MRSALTPTSFARPETVTAQSQGEEHALKCGGSGAESQTGRTVLPRSEFPGSAGTCQHRTVKVQLTCQTITQRKSLKSAREHNGRAKPRCPNQGSARSWAESRGASRSRCTGAECPQASNDQNGALGTPDKN